MHEHRLGAQAAAGASCAATLRSRLLTNDMAGVFIAEYNVAVARLQSNSRPAATDHAAKAELAEVERAMAGLLELAMTSVKSSGLAAKLEALQSRKVELQGALERAPQLTPTTAASLDTPAAATGPIKLTANGGGFQ